MINETISIELQKEKCDFGLNDNLVRVIESVNKLVKLNESINNENIQLKKRIQVLEGGLQEVKHLNTLLNNEINDIKEKNQKKLSLFKDLGVEFLNEINWSFIDEAKWSILIEIFLEIESFSNVICIMRNILISKNNKLNDDEVISIIKYISMLINISSETDINSQDILNLLNILYMTIDEDLLLEFTSDNTKHINSLVLSSKIINPKLHIKFARIQFALEDYNSADIMLMILDEFPDRTLVLDDKTTIDIILMQICLNSHTELSDFNGINMDVLNVKNSECKIILDYFETLKNKYITKDQIIALKNESVKHEDNYSEVTNNIRNIAYQHMAMKLSELDEITIINDLTNIINNDVSEIDPSMNIDNKIYLIKQIETLCPNDSHKLTIKKIVRKVYRTRHDMRHDLNYEYKYIDILYCDTCNSYYINQKLINEIEGKISHHSIRGASKIKHKKVRQNDFDYINTDENKQNSGTMYNEIILREKSPLKLMGYHTNLSHEKRWFLLEKRCIPELGVNKVLYYLQGFIDRFSKQKKDYSSAISKWNYDIERIKSKYR